MGLRSLRSRHTKSSAALVSLGIHALLIVVALSFVAVTVIEKEEQQFEAKPVKRPVQKLRKLKVPVKNSKKKPKPKLRKQIVVKNLNRKTPSFKMPEIRGVKGGLGAAGDGGGGMETIGFSMPELDFFGTKAKGEKVCFLVHFGPATMSVFQDGKTSYTPFSRMTALTIRNRLAELISGLPAYTLFNVAAYYAGDTWALSPSMLPANPANKERVLDWMEPVNPLEGQYQHCFQIPSGARSAVNRAQNNWPTRVADELPFYAPKWVYPYEVDERYRKKYASDAPEFTMSKQANPSYSIGPAFMHWGRAVAWALLEQKPDTIFILTTNYIDGWSVNDNNIPQGNSARLIRENEPDKTARAFALMMRDVYGPDKKAWPSVNVVVLTPAGRSTDGAYRTLNQEFNKIYRSFGGQGSVIEDIKDYMNDEEKELYNQYRSQYAGQSE